MKRCVNCGKSFDPIDPEAEFCSKWCEREYDRQMDLKIHVLTIVGRLVPHECR